MRLTELTYKQLIDLAKSEDRLDNKMYVYSLAMETREIEELWELETIDEYRKLWEIES